MASDKALETASTLGIDLPKVDLGIPSVDEDLNEGNPLEFDGRFGNMVVVNNIPVTEKFDKLEAVVRKISSPMGVIKELRIPIDPATQKTLGHCFIEYNTPQEAELAKKKLHNFQLDRSHILAVEHV